VAKLRVHELAKELGITSKELMGHLKEAGEFVKSSSSSLEPPVVRQMREKFATAPKTKKRRPVGAVATSCRTQRAE